MWTGLGSLVAAAVPWPWRRRPQGRSYGGKELPHLPLVLRLWEVLPGRGRRAVPGGAAWDGSVASRRFRVRCGGGVAPGSSLFRDAGATVLVMVGAYALVRAFDVLTARKIVDQKVSRKVVHVLSGILFMSSWPIFSSSLEARLFASLVPLLNCLRLVIYGFSLATDEGLIKSVTREGKPEELLRGPLYYVLVLMFCALIYWRDSPVGVIALSMMSGGDGVADIMGRKFGAIKLPYNKQKSWVGSICMFASGFSLSMGVPRAGVGEAVKNVALVSLAATAVESLPITDVLDDNISVPLLSMLVASLLFGFQTH
ncbi:unnamed protein product [Spirodela intermedia]|uniref:phytol kinase n=1 Tax=Spirodela intermedia TaxID=51605 RepID=A0A7I8JKC7_SPIIN|nr:unnamed protein product [Spirodela intermedia]CAA6670510.1 unnamed protein product [Spirodela intermedia]